MRLLVLIGTLALGGCGAVYHSPPGISDADSAAFHNALGERRYCTSPNPPSTGMTAINVLAGGLGGAIASSGAVRRAQYDDCAGSLRADGFVPVRETPTMSADEINARRAQQAADAAADSDRRNAIR